MIVPAYPGCVVPLEIVRLGNSTWDFLGVKFWPRDVFGVLILPPLVHPRHLKSGVLPLLGRS